MPSAIIFDVDGTLVDSVALHARTWREVFLEFGKDVPQRDIHLQIGKGGDQLLPVFWSKEELSRLEKPMSERRKEIFQSKYLPLVRGFPQVRELFQRLLKDGKKIALASSAIGEELESYKKIAHIEDLIDADTSNDDAEKSKPHPDIFQAALHKLGDLHPDECLVVGDTPYDIEAAAKAGISTVALRTGDFPEETLSGAIAIYDDPAELLRRYEESPLGA